MLKIYNTLTKKLEKFKPLGKEVKIYSCGPTVYDFPHIGNYRAFVFVDILKRYLLYKNYKVKHVMNITDVDDKIIKKVKESGKALREITSFYEQEFKKGLEELNCIPADFYPRATEHIPQICSLIQKLLDKGYAYLAEDGVYYRIKKFKDYGKLSGIKKEYLRDGSRVAVQEYSKEQASDFVLWKRYTEEDGNIFWEPDFLIGGKKIKVRGRPGWHIECSAMSMHYLGESFDIHVGGVDLIFPHHENEIAQSEAATGKKFVKYWLHNEHLLVEGKKMSKSLGNYFTLKDLLEKGYKGNEIRLVFLGCHYRKQLNFKISELDAARESLKKIVNTIQRIEEVKTRTQKSLRRFLLRYKKNFERAMDLDLDTSKALAVFFEFIREVNKKIDANELGKKEAKEVLFLIFDFDEVFGLGLKRIYEESKIKEIPLEVKKLVEEREKARKMKNFELADIIREKIKKLGFWVDDTKDGPKIRKIK
ncbi:MAG: cysteine--tRNA ligase [Candidatus Pacearchaeota archaeon]|nr:cysteine--tRNA ligase [Candidatus Pacearchaeota archaeon]